MMAIIGGHSSAGAMLGRSSGRSAMRWRTSHLLVMLGVAAGAACRSTDLLTVPPPPNLVSAGSLGDTTGAEALRAGAISEFAVALGGFPGAVQWTAMLSDELRIGYNYSRPDIGIDARSLNIAGDGHTPFDGAYTTLQAARLFSLQAAAALERRQLSTASAEIGEMFALAAYSEVLLGEAVCSGDPLSDLSPSGAPTYGIPLSTDSVFARALAHFDSATAHGGSDATVASLVAVGRGRTLLDVGRVAEAGAAVAGVAPTFVYGTQVSTVRNFYQAWAGLNHRFFTVGDRKGGTGLDFVSSHDARVVTILQTTTAMGLPAYYPAKFPPNPTANDSIPLADGVEAQLIGAEGALSAGNIAGWLGALNQLRANFVALRGPYPADTSYHQLGPLVDPGSDSARVNLTFQERAFWLYGTAHRLGDLRRLIRQYGRDQSTVFPSGPYDNGSGTVFYSTYGSSVAFPIGAIEAGNPNFHGCSSTQA